MATYTYGNNMNNAVNDANTPIPVQYKTLTNLFAPGGAYGQGAYAQIQDSYNQQMAQGMASLAGTGMYSSTNAAGIAARANADATKAKLGVNDKSMELYGDALKTAGSAEMERTKLMAGTNISAAQILAHLYGGGTGGGGSQNSMIANNNQAYMAAKAAGLDTWGMPHS